MTEKIKSTILTAGQSVLTITDSGMLTFNMDGGVWQSSSLCILHYYDRQHPRTQQVLVPWNDSQLFGTMGTLSLSTRSTLDVIKIDELSAMLKIKCDTIHIDIDLILKINAAGDGFDISAAPDSVRENLPRLYRLLGLEILPQFGAATTGEKGYLTLPNWYGCQTFFDQTYPREAWQTIYSSNDQWENVCNAPVFGITRGHGTLCCLIAEGDEDAQLVCRRHWEAEQANSVHPYLVWRWEQQDDLISGPRQVRYSFAGPDCPAGEGYAFAALQYRNFLRQSRGVQNWADKGKSRPEALDYAGRFFLKIFMAYKEPHPEGKGKYHCTCTCDEAREILTECQNRGMAKLAVILVGWGQDGHDGKCPTYLPVDERVSGEEKMKELIAWCRENDIMLGVHTSHNAAYPCSDEFSVDELVRHRTGEYWESIVWSGGQAHRICPQISLNKHVKRDLPALAQLGFHGHHHYDAIGGFMCCHSPEHPVKNRSEYINLIREECRVAVNTMGSLSTEMPFGQYYGVMDGFFHSFTNPGTYLRNCAIGRHFLDRVVPLTGIALHGSHNCGESIGAADNARLTEMVDMGVSPQFEVCMRPSPSFGIPAYETKAAALQKAYAFSFGPDGYMTRLGMLDIDGRWEPVAGVSKTLYSDGTIVTVNRGGVEYDGILPGEYQIKQKENQSC